jgi:hypothetical protein
MATRVGQPSALSHRARRRKDLWRVRAREELHRLQAARGARHLQAAGLPVAGDGACGARARVSGHRAISAPLAGAVRCSKSLAQWLPGCAARSVVHGQAQRPRAAGEAHASALSAVQKSRYARCTESEACCVSARVLVSRCSRKPPPPLLLWCVWLHTRAIKNKSTAAETAKPDTACAHRRPTRGWRSGPASSAQLPTPALQRTPHPYNTAVHTTVGCTDEIL